MEEPPEAAEAATEAAGTGDGVDVKFLHNPDEYYLIY